MYSHRLVLRYAILTVVNTGRLLRMANERRWRELSNALLKPASAASASELLPKLEAIGDQSLVADEFEDASNSYLAAQFCATIAIQRQPVYTGTEEAQAALYRLGGKLITAAQRFAEKSREVTAKPQAPAIEEHTEPPADARVSATASEVEPAMERMAAFAREGKRGSWWPLLVSHKGGVKRSQIATHFEALGDQSRDGGDWFPASEFYALASEALGPVAPNDVDWFRSLRQKEVEATKKVLDARIANPLPADAPLPEPLDSDNGWERVEWLVLSSRFGEADELMKRLESIYDNYQNRGWDQLFRFNVIPEHLIEDHPEMARWFYERLYDAAWAMPADTAYEGNIRANEMAEAEDKIRQASARIARRVATIDAALTSCGMGPRPEPEHYVKTVSDEQVLELVPERSLFTTQSDEAGMSEPIPVERLHRYAFQVRIQGEEVRLTQRADRYGALRPLGLFNVPSGPILLQRNKAFVIEYNLPGGGPVWTLTLADIRPV